MASFGSFDSGGLAGGGIISVTFAVTGAAEAVAQIDSVTVSEEQLEAATRRGAAAQRYFSKAAKESSFSTGFLGKGLSMLTKWGKRAGLVLGISGALLLANGMKFEQQMATVAAVTGAHGRQLQGLSSLAMRESVRSQYSATAAANAEMLLGRASFKTNQIMKLLPATLDLATAAQGNLQETTTLMGETMLAFDLSASKGAHVADVLADATRNGAMSMDDIVQAMKYVGAAAYGSHQPLEDIVGLMKLMALHGVKGSLAGTTLRYALTRLVKPVRQVQDGLKLINMHASDLYGPHGLKPLPNILDTMYKKMKAIGEVNKQKVLVDVFGVRALSGMNALFNQGPVAWKKAIEQMKNSKGLAARLAAEMNNTVPRQFQMLLHAIENIGTVLYLRVEPTVLGFLKRINQAVSPVMKNIGLIERLINQGYSGDAVRLVDAYMGANGRLAYVLFTVGDAFREAWRTVKLLWKVIKPFAVVMGVTLFLALKGIVWLLKKFNDNGRILVPVIKALVAGYIAWKIATLALAIAQWALNVAQDANPILIIIELIALLVLGIYEAWVHFKWFRDSIYWVWNAMKQLFNFFTTNPLGMIITEIFVGPILLIITHWNQLIRFFSSLGRRMATIAVKMWDWMKKPLMDVIKWITGKIDAMIKKVREILGMLPGTHMDRKSPTARASIRETGANFNSIAGTNPAIRYGRPAMMDPQTGMPTASGGPLPPKKVEPWSNPLNGFWNAGTEDMNVTVPLYLDGKKLAEGVAKVKSDKKARKTGRRSVMDQLQTDNVSG